MLGYLDGVLSTAEKVAARDPDPADLVAVVTTDQVGFVVAHVTDRSRRSGSSPRRGPHALALALSSSWPAAGESSSAVRGLAMLSNDFCSAWTPRKIAMMPATSMRVAPT